MADLHNSKLVKRIARLVVEAGEQGLPELRPALARLLEGRSASDRKAFLKAFHKAVVREVQKDTLTVQSAHDLDAATLGSLVARFGQGRTRPLYVERQTDPELIAGVRVRLGDTVFDASLSNSLQALSARVR